MKKLILFSLLFCIALFFYQCAKDSNYHITTKNQGGVGGSTARFAIVGNYLYVVDRTSLKSFDISNSNAPVYKDRTEIGLSIETIFSFKNRLFIGSSNSMYIYELTNPAKPAREGQAVYSVQMACDPVIANDSVAYASLTSNRICGGFGQSALLVYNIKDITRPLEVAQIRMEEPQGLASKDSALYVCEKSKGLRIFNIKDAYKPILSNTTTGEEFLDVIAYNNLLLCQVKGGLTLYDISANPLEPVFLSKISNK
jgi:hypothetical protein